MNCWRTSWFIASGKNPARGFSDGTTVGFSERNCRRKCSSYSNRTVRIFDSFSARNYSDLAPHVGMLAVARTTLGIWGQMRCCTYAHGLQELPLVIPTGDPPGIPTEECSNKIQHITPGRSLWINPWWELLKESYMDGVVKHS